MLKTIVYCTISECHYNIRGECKKLELHVDKDKDEKEICLDVFYRHGK